ncbi:DUF4352 domain-containing protein [bacterium]|nr:DUF4352 domain-containing protein [bacterium]
MLKSSVRRSRYKDGAGSALFLLALLLTVIIAPAYAFTGPPAAIFVNGLRVDTVPITKNGTTYLPIQVMAQALQAEIIWDAKLNSVTVNGKLAPASVVNDSGRIYLPAESFINALGGTVSFDGRNNRILINTSGTNAGAVAMQTNTQTAADAKSSSLNITPAAPVKPSAPTAAVTPTANVYTPPVSQSRYYDNSSKQFKTVPTGNGAASTSTPLPRTNAPTAAVYAPPSAAQPVVSARSGGVQPGYPVAYTPNQAQTDKFVRHVDGNNYLPSNLQAGPVQGIDPNLMTGGSAGLPSNSQRSANGSVYIPKHAQNSVFQVTVTNLETISVLKDFYRPREGYKYVIAYLSQQNVSQQVQVYTGRFSLLDQKSASYDYIEGLSNFWLVILRPYGVNFGYLVFEIPADSKPVSLVLHSLNQAPLAVNL